MKKKIKAQKVAHGIQQDKKMQADNPTALKYTLKLFCSISVNTTQYIASIDI